jgi:putative SOS response-associated peptidase YedK
VRLSEIHFAGLVKDNYFTMLTANPGPDIATYHNRQICLLNPSAGIHWLTLDRPANTILVAPPEGTLRVTTLRRDGEKL